MLPSSLKRLVAQKDEAAVYRDSKACCLQYLVAETKVEACHPFSTPHSVYSAAVQEKADESQHHALTLRHPLPWACLVEHSAEPEARHPYSNLAPS